MSSKVTAIGSEEEGIEFTKKHDVALLFFDMPGCPHCENIRPAYYKMAETKEYSKVAFALVDIKNEANASMAKMLKLTGFPAFVFFQEGQPKDIVRGADEAGVREKLSAMAPKTSFTGNFVSFGGEAE
jgi:thiol-disulfide isomerase/thioredoxin